MKLIFRLSLKSGITIRSIGAVKLNSLFIVVGFLNLLSGDTSFSLKWKPAQAINYECFCNCQSSALSDPQKCTFSFPNASGVWSCSHSGLSAKKRRIPLWIQTFLTPCWELTVANSHSRVSLRALSSVSSLGSPSRRFSSSSYPAFSSPGAALPWVWDFSLRK